ncbi:MAG: hypothetical protein QOH03_3786, partial [Kribbellaceae bacterium]|nr:hypothetical protein [Kribbellaceae bacterium]
MNEVPNDPFYEQTPEPPRSHGRRKQRRGVAGPILGAFAVLALLAGAGWYVTRDTTEPTSQDQPLTVKSMVTPTDDASSPVVTPTPKPSATPTKTPSKTPSATPTPTPTRSTSAPSRQGTRSPKPTKPTPTHTATPKPSTKPPTTKPPAPSGGAEAQVLQLTNQERAKNGCG